MAFLQALHNTLPHVLIKKTRELLPINKHEAATEEDSGRAKGPFLDQPSLKGQQPFPDKNHADITFRLSFILRSAGLRKKELNKAATQARKGCSSRSGRPVSKTWLSLSGDFFGEDSWRP